MRINCLLVPLMFTACASAPDDTTPAGTDEPDTEAPEPVFATADEVWAMQGTAQVSPGFSESRRGGARPAYTGETELVDTALSDGVLGDAGAMLCRFAYPATGVSIPTTQEGVDADNEPVDVTCDGCTRAFALTHEPPTVPGEGAFCEHFYADVAYDETFPVPTLRIAYHPSYDGDETDGPEPSLMHFYDGADAQLVFDDNGDPLQAPAAWLYAGPATLDPRSGTLSWRWELGIYTVPELAFYEQ